jgi:hypothetical protein
VFWIFFDGTQILVGVDQTQKGTYAGTIQAMGQQLYVGGSNTTTTSTRKHGSIQVVQRAGMTLTDAKAIVAKMQTHHSIP